MPERQGRYCRSKDACREDIGFWMRKCRIFRQGLIMVAGVAVNRKNIIKKVIYVTDTAVIRKNIIKKVIYVTDTAVKRKSIIK